MHVFVLTYLPQAMYSNYSYLHTMTIMVPLAEHSGSARACMIMHIMYRPYRVTSDSASAMVAILHGAVILLFASGVRVHA